MVRSTITGRSDNGRANPYNADWPLLHLTSVLMSKPVALLTSIELKKWRDGLLGTMAPSTINRLCGCLCAALNLAAQHDKRIQNRDAWEVGLANLPDAQKHATSSSPTTRCANSSPPLMGSMTSLAYSPIRWR